MWSGKKFPLFVCRSAELTTKPKEKLMSILFEPGTIAGLELRNRLIRSATAEKMCDQDGRPEQAMIDLYAELARGGVGLIVTGHAFVHESGKAHSTMTGVHRDDLVPSLRAPSEVVHREGGKVVMQINHAGRQTSEEVIRQTPVAPSPVPQVKGGPRPHELTEAEIEELIAAFGRAAGRAKEAGFDGVQLHGAHGYLINQFCSPASNWRRDRWGGSSARRLRFLEEVATVVRDEIGDDYPLLIKLGIQDSVRDGLTLDDGVEIVRHLADWGIDAVEISCGIGGTSSRKDILRTEDEAYFLPQARRARGATDLPLILVGGMRSLEVIESILEEGTADFISMSRPLIREPNLPNQWREGRTEPAACISCNNCWPGPGEYGIACRAPK
jgi:2,4-dienoyl-CoA reductase-like NADH-dependent reductase (Old Yellow Enzyme family)